ncbi:MAG: M43 family zinc metalloprotease [Chitinophagaceae bacterium]
MKAKLLVCFLIVTAVVNAQQRCGSTLHATRAIQNNPFLEKYQQNINQFIQQRIQLHKSSSINARPGANSIITIPVVIHVVYHLASENISDDAINKQMDALNRDYRKMNDDSVNTPACFKPLAADCGIQFQLAKVDPKGRATNGVERIYSPVAKWNNDDMVKHKAQFGADAWDADSYLNIWVCSMNDVLGYSSIMGEAKELDGVVINYSVFNDLHDGGAYNSGRTAVHEIGHWLGLKHVWGDADCGDDEVDDTPKQSTYTSGCPGGIRLSCGNTTTGDMYMNYMDYTNDPCMNLFTNGQKERMRVLFDDAGFRNSILSSKALGTPWVEEISLPDSLISLPVARIFPNPSQNEITIDLVNDNKWIGKEVTIADMSGQVILHHIILTNADKLDVKAFRQGMYFVNGNCDAGKMVLKFIKL